MRSVSTSNRSYPIKAAVILTAVILAGAMLAFNCGCAWIGSALESLNGDAAPTAALPTEAAADIEGDGEPPAKLNPVFAMFGEFIADYSAATEGMLRSAAESGDAEAAGMYNALCGCEAELTLIRSTVGMFGSDGAGWSGSFTGAYAGSGSMNSRGAFTYAFEDGMSIAGRIIDGLMYCGMGVTPQVVDPDEPTPVPTEASETEEPSPTGEGPTEAADTEEPFATEEGQTTPAPTEAGSAAEVLPVADPSAAWNSLWPGAAGREETRFALKKTANGWIGAVLSGGNMRVIQLEDGAVSYTEYPAHGTDFPDPLAGMDALIKGGVSSAVLRYTRGEGAHVE